MMVKRNLSSLSNKKRRSSSNNNKRSKGTMNISSFSFNLFAALSANLSTNEEETAADASKNILVSPYSIASSLSLVLAGATTGSQCQNELQTVLKIDSHIDISDLADTLAQSSALTEANGIWSSKDIKQSYVDVVKNTHHAEAGELPTNYEPIDAYITEKTNGLISNMLQGDIDPLTVAILVNGVHFKSDWTQKFDKSQTIDGIFTSADGTKKDAKFMKANRKMNLGTDVAALGGANIVQLDYGGEVATESKNYNNDSVADFAAYFILPSKEGNDGLNEVIQSLASLGRSNNKSHPFASVLSHMSSRREVHLSLPRFKMSYGTKSIKDELKSIGVNECFQDGTLSEMSDDPLVHLDDVLHKAIIEVTEEGTEAAAATVGIVMTRSLPPPPVTLTFDRAFLMVIMHTPTMTPLFLAKVDDPHLMF